MSRRPSRQAVKRSFPDLRRRAVDSLPAIVLSRSVVILALQLGLASVFGFAGGAKLTDREGTAAALRSFGAPSHLAGPGVLLLAGIELGIAAALVPRSTTVLAATAAAALSVSFAAVMAVNLLAGRRPACRCFGPLSAKPISWMSVGRNGALVGCAALIISAGPGVDVVSAFERVDSGNRWMVLTILVLAAATAGLAWLCVELLRRHGRALIRLDAMDAGAAEPASVSALPPGLPAPDFVLQDIDGRTVSLGELRSRARRLLLVFTDARCPACDALLPDVATWQRHGSGDLAVAVIGAGRVAALRSSREEHGVDLVLVDRMNGDRGMTTADHYLVSATPTGVLVGADGRVSAVASGRDGIVALTVPELATPKVLAVGERAPALALPGCDGEPVHLKGDERPALLTFWDPRCPACDMVVADIRQSHLDLEAIRLIVVSRGAREENLDLGLDAEVALDDGDEVTRAFGVSGTPSAVLVDGDGMIASPLAEGRSAIHVLTALTARLLREHIRA
jgi:peroxiredoxin